MQTYNNSVVLKFDTSSTGNADSGALVTIRVASNGALATIYDTQGVQILNPLTTTADGNYSFKANDGIYNIIIREGQPNELTLYGVKFEYKLTTITKQLGELSARMQLGEAVTVACYGDSTTDGNATTGWVGNPTSGGEAVGNSDHNLTAPNAWPVKLRGVLREFFSNNNIEVWNAGYSGQRMDNGWALRNYDAAVTDNPFYGTPDITFIGFGLNDIQGYVLQDHIDQSRLLIEKLIAYGTVPVLLTCGASFRNENNPRDHLEATREINQAKKTIAEEYGIPLIEFGESTQDWIQNNTDRYNWSDEQVDGLHFQDNGHAFQSQFMSTVFLTDLVEFGGGIQEVNSWSSKADYVGDYATRYRLSNNSQGGNVLVSTGALVTTDVMTMYIYSTNPNGYLIYQGIDNEWSESTIAPQINVKEYFDLTTNSKDIISTGSQLFTTSRASDVQYIHSKLKYGLNKVTYKTGNSDRLFYGSFKISESMPDIPGNALAFSGPISRQFSAISGISVEAIGEQPLLVNTAGGFNGDTVSVSFDVEADKQGGILLLTGQGFSGSASSVSNNQQNAIMMFRNNAGGIALYDLAYNDGTPTFRLLTQTADNIWPEFRLTGRFELSRNSNLQNVKIFDDKAGGVALIDFTVANSDRVRWGGYVGGVFYNADTNSLPGNVRINSLVINRNPTLSASASVIPDTGIYTGGTGITVLNNVISADQATSALLGGVLLSDDAVQTVTADAATATINRTYGVQLNASGQAVVNVPWVEGGGATLTGGASITIDTDVINLAIAGGSVVNDTRYLTFHNNGTEVLESGAAFSCNPSTGLLSATTFSGSGASLTSLPSAQLTGTINDARLPATITSSITGNAATVTNGVYTSGNQSISGTKTFTANVTVGSANSEARLLLGTHCTIFARSDKTGFYINGATQMEYQTDVWRMFSTLEVTGTVTAQGSVLTSAAKYKDIDYRESTADSLLKVCAIGNKGVAVGRWKEGDDGLHRWFIADEVDEVMPDVVVKKDGQVEALNYNEMLADAYAAIAELAGRVTSLESKLIT